MKIKVFGLDYPPHEEELEIYSLTYDYCTDSFLIPAGECLIKPIRKFKPVRLHGQWSTLFITFEQNEEAQAFCSWLREADSQASSKLAHMLD